MPHQSRSDRLGFEIVPDHSWRHLVYSAFVEAVHRGKMRPGVRLARTWGVPPGARERRTSDPAHFEGNPR